MPPGHTFEFIVEKEKLENIRKVVSHNQGKVISEAFKNDDIQLKVEKVPDGEPALK
ncbi:MAG: hypothetical protein R6U38_17795 [Desulfatiglandaceae bacterium]